MHSHTTRREFLSATSLAIAGVGLGAHALSAQALRTATPASAYLPDPTPDDMLRALAANAVDAARTAGASYADVRVTSRRALRMLYWSGGSPPISEISLDHAYGIRARVNGVSAFGYGTVPSPDAIAASARRATADARAYVAMSPAPDTWAPAPAGTNGTWTSPAEIDPLSVPIRDQVNLLGAFTNAAMRVPGIDCSFNFDWVVETRVFASTDGSMITQHVTRAFPRASVYRSLRNFLAARVEPAVFFTGSAGFEAVLRPDAQEQIKAAAEEAARLIRLPVRQLDVGRYDVVFTGSAMGALFGETINPAFEMERVLGHDVDAGASSFLSPPDDMLGTQVFTSGLTVRAEQSAQSFTYAKWDDDGVATGSFPVIQQGRIVDYFTTRSGTRASQPSRGCAVAWSALRPPMGYAGYLTIAPGTQSGMTVEALCRTVKRGILVQAAPRVSADPSLLGATLTGGMPLEIRDGQIVGRVRKNTLHVRTLPAWKSLTLGDASTVETHTRKAFYGQPWWAIAQNISAPAAHIADVAVMQLPRTT